MPLDPYDLREPVQHHPDPFACADCGGEAWAPTQRGDGVVVMRGGQAGSTARGWRMCGPCSRAGDPLAGLLRDLGRQHAAELVEAAGLPFEASGIRRFWESGTPGQPVGPTEPARPGRWAHVPAAALDDVADQAAAIVHARTVAALEGTAPASR
ncbi:hypothetical protein ACIPRL_07810 [Streptomyces sp. NPDC090085]|uniref:hypothetical protein n=1 Tax=Streptomyces sp. NPDC090085 TaxID=3365943 RepID=UPI00381D93FB